MPKEEWGVKRLCPHCGSRFYDLKRDPMTCPECDHSFSLESLLSGRGRTLIAEKAPKGAPIDDDVLDTEDEILDDDAGDVVSDGVIMTKIVSLARLAQKEQERTS